MRQLYAPVPAFGAFGQVTGITLEDVEGKINIAWYEYLDPNVAGAVYRLWVYQEKHQDLREKVEWEIGFVKNQLPWLKSYVETVGASAAYQNPYFTRALIGLSHIADWVEGMHGDRSVVTEAEENKQTIWNYLGAEEGFVRSGVAELAKQRPDVVPKAAPGIVESFAKKVIKIVVPDVLGPALRRAFATGGRFAFFGGVGLVGYGLWSKRRRLVVTGAGLAVVGKMMEGAATP